MSLDGLGWVAPENGDSSGLKKYVQQIVYLKDQGLLHRTLISHDAGWYTHGQPGGGRFQPYTNIFTMLIPALKKQGFTTRDIEQLLVKNPQEANIPISQYPNIPISQYPNIPISQYPNIPISQYPNYSVIWYVCPFTVTVALLSQVPSP
ncbi:MAG: hypothetical protein DYG98_15090 [Haliscomenobacteraceae bacterium CHB4]|nr:hypothetical protein [Haliscomenobacteraceae bacterium CHB4]